MIIQIYSKPACTYCDQAEKIAEQIVQAMPANYEKLMLDVDFSMDELIEKVPNAKTFPQVFVDGELVGGYGEFSRMEWLADKHD